MQQRTASGQELRETTDWLKSRNVQAEAGIVLGTGLHELTNHIDIIEVFAYAEIPHFPLSTVEFHKGNLIYGSLQGKKILMMQGRFHFYEGYTMQQIVFPVRVMKLLGISHLLLTNAAGGITSTLKKGDLALVTDHINLQTANPLTGANPDELGPRFPDMSQPYSVTLNELLKTAAHQLNIPLQEGVYASVTGPNLETRAEYRYLKIIGADMVGMSTVPEVIAANHMQLHCAAVSVITDECDPDHLQPVNIQEIIAVAGKADQKLALLLKQTILSL